MLMSQYVLCYDRKADSENMLMTQAMRKALWEERFAVYDRVILRIQFPDHMVVQGVFRPRETG